MKLGELLLQDEFLTIQSKEFEKYDGYFNFKIEGVGIDTNYYKNIESIPTEMMLREIRNINVRPNVNADCLCNGVEIKINLK